MRKGSIYKMFLQLRYILIKFMEKQKEKRKKGSKFALVLQESQSSEDNQEGPHVLKRKIRKRYRKQAGRAMNCLETPQLSPIFNFLASQANLFTTPKEESLNKVVKSLKSDVHVRQILAMQGDAFANLRIENCQEEARSYLELLKQIITSQFFKFGLINNEVRISLNYLRDESSLKKAQPNKFRFLSSIESLLIVERQQIREQIKSYVEKLGEEMGRSQANIQDFNLELLTLCKIAKKAQNSVLDRLSWTIVQEDPLFGCHQEPSVLIETELKNKYITLLVLKNIQEAFREQPIDFYNYHLAIENYEDNMYLDLPYEHINSISSFRKYMLARKPKSHKSSSYLLRTPCSACLSDFSELANPIENCPECHIRIHRYCQRVENRCHRCRYGRTSNAEKNKTKFCYICNRPRQKGLMVQTVTKCAPHQFAHVFCLYISNLWHVQDEEIKGEYVIQDPGLWQCKFCGIQEGQYCSCQKCGTLFHGMCAYFKGCSFRLQNRNHQSQKSYSVRINCCVDKQQSYRLSMQRRFKINLQKIIFRQDEELFSYIEQRMRQCP